MGGHDAARAPARAARRPRPAPRARDHPARLGRAARAGRARRRHRGRAAAEPGPRSRPARGRGARARRRGRDGHRQRRHPHPARGARRPARRPARRDGHADHDGPARVPLRRLPHPHAARPGRQRRVALPLRQRAERDVPRRDQDRARRPRGRGRRGGEPRRAGRRPAARRLAGRARREGRPLEARALPPRAARAGRRGRQRGGAVRRGARRRRTSAGWRRATSSSTPRARPSWRAASPPPSRTRRRCCSPGSSASGVQVGGSHLRRLFWTRPLTAEHVAHAAARIGEHDEDRALLDSAVKANDGFFTTFFVSPYSKYIARWAARRGWTPNGVTTLSVADRLRGGGGVRDRRALGDDRRRGPAPARVHARLRRRPARALHAHVHQARRLAGLDLRPHEGVRGLRRPGDRRLADGRRRLAARRRGADAAGHAPLDRLLLPAGPAPGDGDAAPAAARAGRRLDRRRRAGAARPRGRGAAGGAGPAAGRGPRRRGCARAWRALDRSRRAVWVKKVIGFPIGERFAAISLTAALFDARDDVHRAARLGRLRRDLLRPPGASCARSAGAAASSWPRAPRPRPGRSTPTATTGRSRSPSAACCIPRCRPPRSCSPASRRCSR